MPSAAVPDEATASDQPAVAYVVPRDLRSAAWARWRYLNPPPYMQPGNRHGPRCGVCGGRLGPITRMCVACHQSELEAAQAR